MVYRYTGGIHGILPSIQRYTAGIQLVYSMYTSIVVSVLRVGCACCKCCKCTPCSSFTRVNLPVNAVNIPVNDASFTCKCCGFAQNSCKCCKFSCKCCKFACAVKDEHGVQCKCCKQPSDKTFNIVFGDDVGVPPNFILRVEVHVIK